MLRRILILLLTATICLAQDVARIDQVVQSYVAAKQFMGSVLVARGSDILFSKGYGFADLEWAVPNSPSTKFRTGSITKQFTAASILLLEERGKLKVDAPVKQYLPDAPPAWDNITIFNLLTHTSGIANFTSFPEYRTMEPFPLAPQSIIEVFRDKPLDFAPGTQMGYSNSGYVVLGYLIETVSGQPYAKFLQDNIFTPLGMKDSGVDSTSAVIKSRASGYVTGADGFANAGFIHMSIPYSAGSVYSTTTDLLRWEQALFGGKLLSTASLEKMTTPFKSNYAFGVMLDAVNGRKRISHGGGIEGFNTFLAYFPEDKLTIVSLGNVNGDAPEQIAAKLAVLAYGGTVELPSERKEITLSPQILARYTGTYQLESGTQIGVRLESGHLTAQMSGQGKLPLAAESETRFYVMGVDAQVDFNRDEKGNVTHLVVHQGGGEMVAVRKSGDVVERRQVEVSAKVLERYAGTYLLRPGANLTVTISGSQLMGQTPGRPPFRLHAESETRFFVQDVDAEVEFMVDEHGAVTAAVLRTGPQSTTAPRQVQ